MRKRLILGRLESSDEFKEKKSSAPKKNKEFKIEKLNITVRNLNSEDIKKRNLSKNTKGSLIIEISNKSQLSNKLSVDDIIIEVQKEPVSSSEKLNEMIKSIISKENQTLLLTIITKNNQRRYLGVKLK